MPQVHVPHKIRDEIFAKVCDEADKVNYLNQSRIQNGLFMDTLVNDPTIGGRLEQYMPHSDLKTYIKDALLNRYSKDKRNEAQAAYPTESLLMDTFGAAELIDTEAHHGVELYKSTERENSYCVVAEGTCLKWETTLRHALYYVVSLPEETQDADVQIALRCVTPRGAIPESDKEHIRGALGKINVMFYCIEF